LRALRAEDRNQGEWSTFVTSRKKLEKSKKRTVYAPRPERPTRHPAVVSVELDEDEDVEWVWTHTSDGESVVAGYTIIKRTDKLRRLREVSNDGK
jgi:hypothetical protein